MKVGIVNKSEFQSLIEELNEIDFKHCNPSEVINLLGDSFRTLGSGSEGVVLYSDKYPSLVTKVFFNTREDETIEIYKNLNQSIHLPNTYYVTPNYKIMDNIFSTSLSELLTNVVAKEFVYPNIFEGGGYFTKFNNQHYETKMKNLIDYIISNAKNGAFINDLSTSNIHYNLIDEEFIVLDYDMLSGNVLEFPRFLEENSLTVYKEYFLNRLMEEEIDLSKCLDLFNRIVPRFLATSKEPLDIDSCRLNWFSYMQTPLSEKSRKNVDTLSHYII